MSRVFLIAQPTVSRQGQLPDLSGLAEYGDVHVVVASGDSAPHAPGRVFRTVQERLKDFRAEDDYLVWAGGDTLTAVLVGAQLERLGLRSFRWLRFDRDRDPETGERLKDRGRYVPVEVTIYAAPVLTNEEAPS